MKKLVRVLLFVGVLLGAAATTGERAVPSLGPADTTVAKCCIIPIPPPPPPTLSESRS